MITRFSSHHLSVFQPIHPKEQPFFLDVLSGDDYSSHHAGELLETLPMRGFAVVGTRYPQRRSIELMEQTFEAMKGQNIVIISGFARGVDSRAHELAIDYGLKTIAVLGCGIDVDYPRENRHLKKRILETGGLLVSEFERDTTAFAGNFLKRNRIIAAFSKAAWVVEGAAISGTLNTASWVSKYNRELFATPCFPGDPFYQGNEKLLSEFETGRYPIARPFFGSGSLRGIWSDYKQTSIKQEQLSLIGCTQIQRWVTELKSIHGVCPIQSLMNLAYQNGLTPGKFYLQLEEEIQNGKVFHHPDGSVSTDRF